MKRMTLFVLCLFISIGWAAAQNRTVKGNVISSEDNLPVIQANVVVVGQPTIGTVTDFDGNFTLSVPSSAKQLQVSYTGLKTEIVAITDGVMKITLHSDAKALGDVVVVGYGTGRKIKSVAGSIARVSSEQLQEKPVANIMDALQGQVAGMNVETGSGDPNAIASVQIHGTGSLGAGSAPLYIVDGVQTTPSVIASMNPNDFESITVLKDANATAIFGARAANGVIVVTTKRGKGGENSRFSLSTQYGVSQLISRGNVDDMMSGKELLEWQARNGFLNGDKPWTPSQLWAKLKSRGYDLTETDFDWLDFFMGKNAPTVQADLSVAGGSDKSSYYLSLGYFDQEGISRERARFSKYNARINLESRLRDWLKLGVNTTLAYTKAEETTGFGRAYYNAGTYGAMRMPRYYTPYDKEGKLKVDRFTKTAMAPLYFADYLNMVSPSTKDGYIMAASGFIQISPIKGLTLKTLGGVDLNIHRSIDLSMPSGRLGDGLGARTDESTRSRRFTLTNTAEYKFDFAEKNFLTFLAGQEFLDYWGEGIKAKSTGQKDDRFMQLNHGQLGEFLVRPSSSETAYAYNSYFGRVNYDYDHFFYIDGSIRNDASSRFGSNHRSGWFYSVGSMFDIHSKFMPDNEKFSTFQIKASYGTTGNSEIGNYAHQALIGSTTYDGSLAWTVASAGNPDLTWETQEKINAGFNLGFLRDRITAEVDFYVRNTRDMLMNVPMPYATGFGFRYENVGSMRNMGVDLTLDARLIQTKDWNLNFKTTFNYNQEEITKLFYGLKEYEIPGMGILYEVGKPATFYAAKFAGVDENDGLPMWYVPGKGGETTKEYNDLKLKQSTGKKITAPINGGFSFNLAWVKTGLSLQADFAYVLGKTLLNNDRYFMENNSGSMAGNRSRKLLNEWTEDNRITDIPKHGVPMQFDDRLLENASYLRMKNIQLSYQFPKSIFSEKTVLSGARVYAMARNLFTVTNFTGMDPESPSHITINQFPNTRQFMAGMQLQF